MVNYYFDVIFLCNKVDPNMPEAIKVQHLLRGLNPSLLVKVYPFLKPESDSKEFLRLIQIQTQASQLAGRQSLLNSVSSIPQFHLQPAAQIPSTSQPQTQQSIPNLVAVSSKPPEESRTDFESKITQEMKEMRKEFAKELNADRQLFLEMFKQVASSNRPSPKQSYSKDSSSSDRVRYKRTHDGRPICARCDLPGHITRLCFTKLDKKNVGKGTGSNAEPLAIEAKPSTSGAPLNEAKR